MTTANPPRTDSTNEPPTYRLKIHSTKLPNNPHIENQNNIPLTGAFYIGDIPGPAPTEWSHISQVGSHRVVP